MSEYVNRVSLEFNGITFEDFESWTDNSVILHKQVNLMNKTGHAKMTPRYAFSVSVKIPNIPPGVDLDEVSNGTCTVEFESGKRITYGGVYTLETGEGTADGETELTRSKSFGAENKVVEN
jgi:hypothetical protein